MTALTSSTAPGDRVASRRSSLTRRDFVRMAGVAPVAMATAGMVARRALGANVAGSDTIRIALIGAGARGTDAVFNCLAAGKGIEVVAIADLFEDCAKGCFDNLKQNTEAGAFKVTPERVFWGFDAYRKALATDCNYVILTTPPHFRPQHLKAAVEAGKHAFVEKPVAVDPAGVRSVIASAEIAAKKKVGIVAGTQRRRMAQYREIIKRVHDGAIGDIVAAQCYWLGCELGYQDRQPAWSDMEYQCRNWWYHTWLSGDHITEQHVHNLDIALWAIASMPRDVIGMGGRQVRTDKRFGNVFDHFAIEFSYENGILINSYCRQTDNCTERVNEVILGTKGTAHPGDGIIKGEKPYTFEGDVPDPLVLEHADLVASIRVGAPLNEGRQIAQSTMLAVAGRMSAYTGREFSFDWVMNASKLDLTPPKYELGPLEDAPVAVPGTTPLT